MQTWLFQANPKTFDIDSFLDTLPPTFLWLVTRSRQHMQVGDRVFIWRAVAGDDESRSGVVAETTICELPLNQPDDAVSRPFWHTGDPADSRLRVRLRTVRIVTSQKEIVQRKWANEDPILKEMTILKTANATNFLLTDVEAARLKALWAKTGRNFSYAESVAALWVYKETYGGPVSRGVGSPVSDMALRIGCAVTGIYNKVMNFRHIDPRDVRAGLSGAGEIDRVVWSHFFDTESQELRTEALDVEYQRLWGEAGPEPPDTSLAQDEAIEREVKRLSSLTLSALMDRYARAIRPPTPQLRSVPAQRFDRDPVVAAIAKARADFRCEVPGCSYGTFLDTEGRPYSEVHHIDPLACGGADTPDNVACVCPTHHREAHHGAEAEQIRCALLNVRRSDIINGDAHEQVLGE